MALFFYLSDGYLVGMGIWLAVMVVLLIVLLKARRAHRLIPGKLRLVHAGFSLWMLLASLTGMELYCALFVDLTDSFSITNISKRWAMRHERKNQGGFRDLQEFRMVPPQGTRRVAFAGDSFAFGHGVEDERDRFSDRISVDLELKRPGKFYVNNIALPGYDAPGVVNLIKHTLSEGCRMDVIVYSYCLNDIEYLDDSTSQFYQKMTDRRPESFLFRNTYFFNMVYVRANYYLVPDFRDYFSFVQDYYNGPAWDKLLHLFDGLIERCVAYNAELRIAIFPFMHNLGPQYPFRPAHQKLVEYFQSKNIRVMDLEPYLTPHAAEGLTVNRFDAHPSVLAHKLAAEAMEKHLLDDLFDGKE